MPGHLSDELPAAYQAARRSSAPTASPAEPADPVGAAITALRSGQPVLIESAPAGTSIAVTAAEIVPPDTASGPLRLVLSRMLADRIGRTTALNSRADGAGGSDAVALTLPAVARAGLLERLWTPQQAAAAWGSDAAVPTETAEAARPACALERAAVSLAKQAALLPIVEVRPVHPAPASAVPLAALPRSRVSVADIAAYQTSAGLGLQRVADARVPLAVCEDTRVIAFRPADGGNEHLAILLGAPDLSQPVLTRVHSACFTGDLLGSLRCDCGDQLRGALAQIAAARGGLLIYLAQEGRGIGLVNKLRAYRLQDDGLDTFEANHSLGFDSDERDYGPAADILHQLGIQQIRLMTNNPDKIDQLVRHGITVTERVPHRFPASPHSGAYLRAKAERGGHLF